MDEQRIIELETRLAYQEQALHELNEALASQQVQLTHLAQLAKSLRDRIAALDTTGAEDDTAVEERPPHY